VLHLKSKIGRRLKKLRTEKGLTQKGLAATVRGGLDYTYIGKIERGEQLPSLKILLKISEALSVPVSSFFPDETVSAVCDVSAPEMDYQAGDERRGELFATLKLLHEDDIPLLIEIARVLTRHRATKDR
jgi:transcriptional regulator with XRE-family HTH domain